jgi:hypothetical protein
VEVRTPSDRQSVLPPAWQARQLITLVTGAMFVVAAVAGFAVTGVSGFVDHHTGETLLGLEVNPLHNVVHLVFGVAGLVMGTRLTWAQAYGWQLLVGYGGVFVFGLFAVEETDINLLSLNQNDNWFHLALALVGLLIVLIPERDRARGPSPPSADRHSL